MKYKKIIAGLAIVVLLIVSSIIILTLNMKTNENYNLGNSEGLIIEYYMANMGLKRITDVTDYNIAIYEDKAKITLDIHGDFNINNEKTIELTTEQVKQVKESIEANKLLSLYEKDIDGTDGFYTTMKIYTENKIKTIGGYLYDDIRYQNVQNCIEDMVKKELEQFISETQVLIDKAMGEKTSLRDK